jgi:hypothetical protein
VPNYYIENGVQKRNYVGCDPVAIGQIMAYHKYPPTYNWSLLTAYPAIEPTRVGAAETPTQSEVARLLYDIASAAGTQWPSSGVGSTPVYMNTPALNAMGYNSTVTYYGSNSTNTIMKTEIQNHRPMLHLAFGTYHGQEAGHAWVVDGVLTYGSWKYYSGWVQGHSGIPNGSEVLFRKRELSTLIHHNWGWDGRNNGWYWNLSVPYSDCTVSYSYDKYLYTDIKPK